MRSPAGNRGRSLLCAAVLSLAGCISPREGMVTDVDPVRWDAPAGVVIPNADTTSLREMALFLRLNDRFGDDTVSFRIEVRTPDSLRCEETVLFAVPRGQSSAARARIADIPYRSRVQFPLTGDYRLTVTPCRPLQGVEAVGVRLQPTAAR
ncbi:hypothetical protein [Alistipes sp.]|uniref:hypothetical protein n=1 Tax=Alistipes sp. TaxID=1872444 RepID=UPI003AF03817